MTSSTDPTRAPGLRNQAGARTFFRVAGCLLTVAGVVVFAWGVVHVFGYDGYGAPSGRYLVAFLGGLPLIGVGLMCLQVGFLGFQRADGTVQNGAAVRAYQNSAS